MKRFYLLGLLCCCASILFAQQSASYTGAVINEVTVVKYIEKEVTIISNVPTIRVIDKESHSLASIDKYTLRCGKHHILLQAEGYLPLEDDIVVTPDGQTEYAFYLYTTHKDVTIITNVPTERIVDGQQLDVTDAGTYSIRCGDHKLEMKANGYWPKSTKLAISHNARSEYNFKLLKKPVVPTEWQQFVMLDYTWGGVTGYNPTSHTSSLGVRYGWQKLIGWYVTMNVSLQGGHYAPSKFNLAEKGTISRNKLSLMGGVNVWLGCPLYFYMGIGYGYENVFLVSEEGYTRPYNPHYYYRYPNSGVAWEFGFQGGYKGFTLRLGYALVGSSSNVFNELSLGIGYTFNLKK